MSRRCYGENAFAVVVSYLFIRHSSKSLSVQTVPTHPSYPWEAYWEILSTIDNDDGDVMKIRIEEHVLVVLHVLCCVLLWLMKNTVNISRRG